MPLSRGPQKVERVTITLVPTSDDRGFRHVPSTFSPANRTYGWRKFDQIGYMIVPKKINNHEIKVDIFVELLKKGKAQISSVQKFVQDFVNSKIQTEWHGLKLGSISRATEAEPPNKTFKRATIEEILGAKLDN